MTHSIKRPVIGTIQQTLVILIHRGLSDACRTYLPIKRIVLPQDSTKSKTIGDRANAIIDITKRRLKKDG
jgi:hypothetical protein